MYDSQDPRINHCRGGQTCLLLNLGRNQTTLECVDMHIDGWGLGEVQRRCGGPSRLRLLPQAVLGHRSQVFPHMALGDSGSRIPFPMHPSIRYSLGIHTVHTLHKYVGGRGGGGLLIRESRE